MFLVTVTYTDHESVDVFCAIFLNREEAETHSHKYDTYSYKVNISEIYIGEERGLVNISADCYGDVNQKISFK